MNDFVIKPRRTLRYWTGVTVLSLLLLSLAFFIIQERLYWDREFSAPWRAAGKPSAQDLFAENAGLRERLLVLGQNSRVDKQAAALLQKQLITSQEEIFQLRKDLEFYQGIMNVRGDENSPIIHGMRIKPLTYSRGYRLEVILLHITNTDRIYTGTLDVVVEGMLDSMETRLSLNEISLDRSQEYAVRFRNFQRFEDNFILPERFEPYRVLVTLSIGDEEESRFEKVFDWPVTEEGETTDVG